MLKQKQEKTKRKGRKSMAVSGNFKITDYTKELGLWKIHFVNNNPGGGNPSDYYVEIPEAEIPVTMNQTQLRNLLIEQLGFTYNQTFGPLNTAIAAGMTITIP